MSCQQLIQEDPYIFTDTVSNSANFMHENNSQTKYVPLNRQTIYNRQFRQHEPKIASPTDLNSSLIKSTAYSDHRNKIIISPISTKTTPVTTLKERKNNSNELNNGKILNTTRTSPNLSARTSPKFFKSHQNVSQPALIHNNDDGQQQQQKQISSPNINSTPFIKSNNNSSVKTNNSPTTINHSNSSVSKSIKHDRQHFHHENNEDPEKCLIDQNNVSVTLENGITGIKTEKEETGAVVSSIQTNKTMIKIENDENTDTKLIIKTENDGKLCDDNKKNCIQFSSSNNNKNISRINSNNKRTNSNTKKRNVSNQNVIVEPISAELNATAPLVQLKLNVIDKRLLHQNYYKNCSSNSDDNSNRDERLSLRKMHLRHVLNQYKGINRLRDISIERYKMQISKSFKYCKIMEREKQRILKKSIKICSTKDCTDEAIVLSDYCAKHILSTSEKEQFLIRMCCFRHLDGQQCRVPVSNIMARIAVCNDHMNAPAHQLISGDSIAEPKKNPVQRKQRTKTNPLIRPVKKSGKGGRKKKISSSSITLSTSNNILMPAHRPTMIIHPSDLHHNKNSILKSNNGNSPSATLLKQENLHQNDSNQFIHFNSGNLLASSQSSYGSMSSGNEDLYIKQDLMPCGETSDLSEDTGVGGLSENELISHDVIGHFDMESCAELSKVLSSLPSNTLDDLLTEPLHTSRDDEEYLDRAIEEVSASGMDQIAITAFEHLEGLDMLDIDDDEQRQMISAATNLISMSSYMHDQDNYSAMPSPMMS